VLVLGVQNAHPVCTFSIKEFAASVKFTEGKKPF
jgi:hypothetical protein